jgi:hypothetical protein
MMGHPADYDQLNGEQIPGELEGQDFRVDLTRLIQALSHIPPEGGPEPDELITALRRLQNYHVLLSDWIALDGHLNDILFKYGSFFREVERLSAAHEDPEPTSIGKYWRPISQRVAILLDWAGAPRSFFETQPFARLEDRMVGPLWAIQLCAAGDRLDEMVRPEKSPRLFVRPPGSRPPRPPTIDINELLDAASEFHDLAERTRYLAYIRMQEISAELLNFSNPVLGSLEAK